MIYAISDLHLGFSTNKKMDIFGDIWLNHYKKIENNWQKIIKEDDLVILTGDTSWAMNLEDAKIDLNFIQKLNGHKIIGYGNHDFWFNSQNILNNIYSSITFLKRNYVVYNDYIICAIKGSMCPNEISFTQNDDKLYKKEIKKFRNLLLEIKNIYPQKEIILITHYPPTNDKLEVSSYIDIINNFNIKTIIYGHLHNNFDMCIKGKFQGATYYLTSCDFLNFIPKLIIDK